MLINQEIDENFRFLCIEIQKQVDETKKILLENKQSSVRKLLAREDYVDNLKSMLTNKSFKLLACETDNSLTEKIIDLITVINNLEKIGDFCENIVRQIHFFKDRNFIAKYDYESYLSVISNAVSLIYSSFFNSDLKKGLELCQAEVNLDQLFSEDFEKIIKHIKEDSNQAENLITTLFIFRYFERIGDSLQNIGEAIISSLVGSRIKINQFIAMNQNLEYDKEYRIENLGAETKSGCRIDKIKENSDKAFEVIFKEGKKEKIAEEKSKLDMWNLIHPGIAPQILKYQEHNENASLLLEFLNGQNLKELIFKLDPIEYFQVKELFLNTLQAIWQNSLKKIQKNSNFIPQLKVRFEDVSRVHPYLKTRNLQIGDKLEIGINELITASEDYEKEIYYPFEVLIHGDFNVDNIIYNKLTENVHFIDLHRSELGDYLQDISVFLVSNFRLPVFNTVIREKINRFISDVYDFAKKFADQNNDNTFDTRLSLGLARSFISSTRFTTNKEFAKNMFNRGTYLLEKTIEQKGQLNKDYKFNENILYY